MERRGEEYLVARCPSCESVRIVIVVSPQRRAFCTACGTRWVQNGSEHREVKRVTVPLSEPAIRRA
jgi:hypothetical protein